MRNLLFLRMGALPTATKCTFTLDVDLTSDLDVVFGVMGAFEVDDGGFLPTEAGAPSSFASACDVDVEAETDILFQREMLAPGYLARFIPARIGDAEVRALSFLADHAVPDVRPDLTHEEQVRYVAHGAGDLGTSRDYLAGIVEHLMLLGIVDAHCTHLLSEVDGHLAALAREATSA